MIGPCSQSVSQQTGRCCTLQLQIRILQQRATPPPLTFWTDGRCPSVRLIGGQFKCSRSLAIAATLGRTHCISSKWRNSCADGACCHEEMDMVGCERFLREWVSLRLRAAEFASRKGRIDLPPSSSRAMTLTFLYSTAVAAAIFRRAVSLRRISFMRRQCRLITVRRSSRRIAKCLRTDSTFIRTPAAAPINIRATRIHGCEPPAVILMARSRCKKEFASLSQVARMYGFPARFKLMTRVCSRPAGGGHQAAASRPQT